MKDCYLRKATEEDLQLLFQWSNDEAVRKNSFHTEEIDFETHTIWFKNKLKSPSNDIYIYCVKQEPIGQIRLEYRGEYAAIHYSIEKKYRGQGHGRKILVLAEEITKKNHDEILYLSAEVKKDNIASRKKFKQLSYESSEYIKYEKKIRE